MAQGSVVVAACLFLVGLAVIPPVVLFQIEHDRLNATGIVFATAACLLIFGAILLVIKLRRGSTPRMPSGARIAVTANIIFLAFFALEFSDLMVRHDGKLNYWTNYLIPPAILIFVGMLRMRPWAWWASRGIAALGVMWFVGFTFLIPYGNIARDGVPADWVARLRMMIISLLFASILAAAFWAIGQTETRRFFGLTEKGKASN